MKKTVVFLVLLLSVQITFAQNGTEPILVTDMTRIKTVGSIALTPDGKQAAFTVTEIEPDKKKAWDYQYVTQIWLADTDGKSAPRQLTTRENSSQPAWSPDGRQIAFVRTVDGKPQIFLLPLSGGEAVKLTKFQYGASNPKWSPDGTKLLFSSSISLEDLLSDSVLNAGKEIPAWSLEKPGKERDSIRLAGKADPNGNLSEIRAYLKLNEKDKKAQVFNKLNFQDEMNLNPQLSFNQYFVIGVKDSSHPVMVTKKFYRFGQAEFTPDGRSVILAGSVDSTSHPDRVLESGIYTVKIDGTGFKKLLAEKEKRYFSPSVSPTGKWLAYQHGSTSFVSVPTLTIMPLASQKDTFSIAFDRNKGNLLWSKDEKYLYFTAQSNGGVPLYRVNMATRKVERLSDYDSGINDFDVSGNKIVFSKTEVINPSELFVADVSMKNPVRLSALNAGWLASKKLSLPDKRTFVNEKGETVEYWVMKPSDFRAGKKYPMLLEIHGGPSAMWGPGEASMWHEYQYFCSQGFGVVYANPRGSGGYGEEFLRSNINDWGAGPASDVLTALDKTSAAESWVDTSKLLVTGGSYAGYLTAWIIAHDHRFKAACSQRGVYDLFTFFGEGNAWRLIPNYFGGYPWEEETRKILERESPSSYVQNITTPYIIFHGANDRRTGFVQAEMIYRSLKVLGRPVEFVVHPGASHEITRSGDNRQRIDQMLRTYEFFERWLGR